MFNKLVTRILKRRHFWRYIGFAELAELYTSRMMRVLAMNMITVLIAIFLYQNGYSVAFIAAYFALYFLLRAVCAAPTIYIIAWVGPKHATLWGNVLYIPALLFLWLAPEYGVPALAAALLFKAFSTTLYDISYTVDFSKVKHAEHAGKELGYMQIFEKVATALSPLLGGAVAFLFGPQVTIILAALLFLIAAGPLFFTGEPLPVRQKVTFKALKVRHLWRNLIAEGAGAASNEASNGSTWSLFILICILGTATNNAYLEIGALSAISLFASLAISYVFGLLIDHRRGGELLKLSTVGVSMLHVLRPFLPNPTAIAAMNAVSEVAVTGYKMPFMRGMFDEADSKSGHRVLYLSAMNVATCIGAALANGALALLALLYGEKDALHLIFFGIAVISLLIATHGFRIYQRRR
jgi:MFS family permease